MSKGAYLTILKRKNSTKNTEKKTKQIYHLKETKKTVKPMLAPRIQNVRRSPRLHNIIMRDRMNTQYSFAINADQKLFRNMP